LDDVILVVYIWKAGAENSPPSIIFVTIEIDDDIKFTSLKLAE